jgi:hypothetical protein
MTGAAMPTFAGDEALVTNLTGVTPIICGTGSWTPSGAAGTPPAVSSTLTGFTASANYNAYGRVF